MKIQTLLAALFALSTLSLSAVTPQTWSTTSADEFLSGDFEKGFAVTAKGELKPGPTIRKIVSIDDPFVLAQATDSDGTIYVGTGNSGKVYRLRGGKLEEIFKADEPEVYAVALAKGKLYAASSPYGKIYEIDLKSLAAKVLFKPEGAYVWALAIHPDGSLLAATGLEGKIVKISGDGKPTNFFDAPESHIRSLAVAGRNRILAGGADQGRIYEIDASGKGRALYDSSFTEITAITIDAASGYAWAAAVTSTLPSVAPPRPQQGAATQTQQPEEKKPESGDASVSVDVSFSYDESATPSVGAKTGASEIYRIAPDGFVELAGRLEKETVYGLAASASDRVFAATGPNGRVYEIANGDLALTGVVAAKQAVSIAKLGSTLTLTTTNGGAVYAFEPGASAEAEFRSAAQDCLRFSSFGAYRMTGTALEGCDCSLSFRSGNSSTPDNTWSDWTKPTKGTTGSVSAPPARYIQWKLNLDRPSAQMRIDSFDISFVNRNLAPILDSVTVMDPGAVFVSASYPASPQVLEATNPDEYGIFNSLDLPRERNDPGKRLFRKGYRTISWRAHDDNGDSLRADLHFRRIGESAWLRLRENVTEGRMNFDASQLPDGRYEVRLTLSDEPGNPQGALATVRDGIELVVDNTPPAISSRAEGTKVRVRVSDAQSPVVKAEYAIEAKEWVRMTPIDGIADSPVEEFELDAGAIRGKFVIVRVVDEHYNVATSSVRVE